MAFEVRNFGNLQNFYKARPEEAHALVEEWNHFVDKHPEVANFTTAEQLTDYAEKNPGFGINTNIWVGNELAHSVSEFRHNETLEHLEHLGQEDHSSHQPLSTSLMGLSSLPFLRENDGVLEEDKDYLKTKESLEKEWIERNPGK